MTLHAALDVPTDFPTAPDLPTAADYHAMRRWAASLAPSDLPALPSTTERSWVALPAPAEWDAWLIGWPTGSQTGWHDHQGAAGLLHVLSGTLTEFSIAPAATRSTPSSAGTWADVRTRWVEAGGTRSFGARHVHHVVNEFEHPALSVHVYAPRLDGMTRYRWHGEELLVAAEHADASGRSAG
jgi:hypothetical protein